MQERFALASVVAEPDDLIALRSWFGFHGDRSDHGDERNRAAYASIRGCGESGRALLESIVSGAIAVTGAGQQNVKRRARSMIELLDGVPNDLVDQIEYLFDPALADHAEDDEKREWIRRDLQQLRDAALEAAEGAESLAEVMSRLRYRIATRAPLAQDDQEPRVQIMTLHSAKGLQGDNVVVAGVAEQIVPGDADGEERAEQRRLLYVAITRAKHELVVSWPRQASFADAMANGIRLDGVITVNGNKVVQLARSSLLPQSLAGIMAGAQWLDGAGVP